MNHYYLKLTKEFCEKYTGYCINESCFNYAVGLDGEYYVSVNSMNDFPEIFEGVDLVVVLKNINEFPHEDEIQD